VLLSFILSKKMTRPLEDLTDAVAAVSEGRLGHRVGIPGEDEIGRLSEAFNRMAHALELQESLRKKVTSNIAHELRTPVSVIQGELEGMMDGYIPVDREHIQSLHAEIGRFKTIIEGLEELARAEASSLSLRKQSFALEPFLRDILERHRKMFADKGVAQGLSCQEGLVISADPDRMSQVIINLLSNALKATGENGKVEVRALEKGSTVIVEVADTGVGIKQEDLPFIFERFYKAENGGLGLGLAIARELVQAHGGSITVNSDYGKGATFAVTLPR
jgi:two-component system sensor histidine kinase BaeS